MCLRHGAGVLAGAEEKEERQANHVRKGKVDWVGSEDGLGHDVLEDGDRDRFDASGRCVGLGVALEHASKAKVGFALGRESWVLGPHCRERLANAP